MVNKIKKQSVKLNFLYQFVYQAIILVIPLIVSPYLTRVLEDAALGTFSYVNSIAYYFVLLANLGISKHGQRVIAQSGSDLNNKRTIFWSLYFLHLIFSIASLGLYFAIFSFFNSNDKSIYLIQGIYVASALFDVTWLFYGLENFKSVVFKNAIIKIIECLFVFLLVKTSGDLWIYTLISSSSILLGQLIMLPQAFRLLPPIKFKGADVVKHLKPMLVFSISVIAISLYTVFDKTLLGLMTTKENVAYYEYANKIIALPRTFISIVGVVMLPRACKMVAEKNYSEQKKYLKIALTIVYFIGFASLFGLLTVSRQFAVLYYGNLFAESGNVMMAMCALPLIVGMGDVIRTQYLIPNKMDKPYIVCIIINAVINIVLSSLLIPVLGIYGAVIGTLAAETFGLLFQLFICRKMIPLLKVFILSIPFIVIGLIMFASINIVSLFLSEGIWSLLIKIIVGAFVFLILFVLYLFLFDKELWDIAIGRLFKKVKIEGNETSETNDDGDLR